MSDVGGVWGWAEFLAAVNDPTHERHNELMEWAGLEPGERIDPTFFDAAAINRPPVAEADPATTKPTIPQAEW